MGRVRRAGEWKRNIRLVAAAPGARDLALALYQGYGSRQVEPLAAATRIRTAALRCAYVQAFDAALAEASRPRLTRLLKVAVHEKARSFANRIAQTELAPKPIAHPFCRCVLRSRPDLRARDAREREGAERTFLRGLSPRDAARAMGSCIRLQRVLNGESALAAWNRGKDKAYRVAVLGDTMPTPLARSAPVMNRRFADRVPSAGTPDVVIVDTPDVVQDHGLYPAAKGGDLAAAVRLVADFMAGRTLAEFVAELGSRRPILVGVTAVEAGSVNEIPAAMVDFLASRTDLFVADDIIQVNKAGHTKASGWFRLAHQAIFDGPVMAGAEYWLLDDFVGQGGTFANLRSHIERGGGRVIGMTALTGRAYSAKLTLTSETLEALRAKHGELETWWRREFGFGFEALTESEARYLFRAENADTIRNRLAEATQQGGSR